MSDRPDKPFHKAECKCAECLAWIAANPLPVAAPLLAAEINALPERVRQYIHDLEANADPSGNVREIAALKENLAAVLAKQQGGQSAPAPQPQAIADQIAKRLNKCIDVLKLYFHAGQDGMDAVHCLEAEVLPFLATLAHAPQPQADVPDFPDRWGHWIDKDNNHWWICGRPGKFMAQCLDPETGMPDDETPMFLLSGFAGGMRHGWHRVTADVSATTPPLVSAEVNALPERVRRYVHDLETNCDPSGMVRENVALKENAAALGADNERLRRERDNYKRGFDEAITAVDRVFQIDSTKPPPLLPDFLRLGESKFQGVIKLAEAYTAAQAEAADLRTQLAAVRKHADEMLSSELGDGYVAAAGKMLMDILKPTTTPTESEVSK